MRMLLIVSALPARSTASGSVSSSNGVTSTSLRPIAAVVASMFRAMYGCSFSGSLGSTCTRCTNCG